MCSAGSWIDAVLQSWTMQQEFFKNLGLDAASQHSQLSSTLIYISCKGLLLNSVGGRRVFKPNGISSLTRNRLAHSRTSLTDQSAGPAGRHSGGKCLHPVRPVNTQQSKLCCTHDSHSNKARLPEYSGLSQWSVTPAHHVDAEDATSSQACPPRWSPSKFPASPAIGRITQSLK